uniref:Uncharacterized protein n=1 Tax=Candidatus Kentrum sp. UNK TaxID=2126344 RepID=A0A451ANB5_9GAMM|nr:MAG: hypothetical protein BECKUNK1418G_GA0071005_11478 [Candidatus Kentron sp. UNK]VFK72748.1 MAG: hypothetical protein BECKUNK1418H_GA0071006_11368 [Candidatus Kentron sp. UNK]
MIGNSDFHFVEFFRETDEHAALLLSKTLEEIVAFFSRRNKICE